MVPYKFNNYLFSFVKNAIGVLTRMALNLQMALGGTDVLTRLHMGWESILAVDEHGMSPHSFLSFPGSFVSVWFSVCRSFAVLVKFMPWYFVLSDAAVHGIAFLISLKFIISA